MDPDFNSKHSAKLNLGAHASLPNRSIRQDTQILKTRSAPVVRENAIEFDSQISSRGRVFLATGITFCREVPRFLVAGDAAAAQENQEARLVGFGWWGLE